MFSFTKTIVFISDLSTFKYLYRKYLTESGIILLFLDKAYKCQIKICLLKKIFKKIYPGNIILSHK